MLFLDHDIIFFLFLDNIKKNHEKLILYDPMVNAQFDLSIGWRRIFVGID